MHCNEGISELLCSGCINITFLSCVVLCLILTVGNARFECLKKEAWQSFGICNEGISKLLCSGMVRL